ncbi:MAG: 16S rRNA (cytosine(1402)-N(4))-methyltransferase RsmH [Verrucomicrobiota bacterium]
MESEPAGGAGGAGGTPSDYHRSVLWEKSVQALQPTAGKVLVDCTLGGGGHAEGLLQAGARVIGLDRDGEALAHARDRLAAYGNRFQAVQTPFSGLEATLKTLGWSQVDGVLADLGVSSRQLDAAERGFSFQKEGPLDMRMQQDTGPSAADLLATAEEAELAHWFSRYGEEPESRRVAAAIVAGRSERKLTTTQGLVEVIQEAKKRFTKHHPATRVFQALRMVVNRELEELESLLETLPRVVAPGGRAALISFHSLEDRPIKQTFRRYCQAELDDPTWPAPRPNPEHFFQAVTRKPLVASPEEAASNPRARSAKLRIIERL